MFRAYFHVSMELVRDVVKTMEESLVETFDDEAAKPVSSVFTAPIPAAISDDEDDNDDNDESHNETKEDMIDLRKPSPLSKQKSKIKSKVKFENDYSGTILSDGIRPQRSQTGIPSVNTSINYGSRQFKRIMHYTPTNQAPTSPQSPTDIANYSLRRISTLSSYPPLRELEAALTSPTLSFGGLEDEYFPMIEALSQDAIEELVERIYGRVEGEGKELDYEMFEVLVGEDTNVLAWFEALGSIF